jgi:hypothetical protein
VFHRPFTREKKNPFKETTHVKNCESFHKKQKDFSSNFSGKQRISLRLRNSGTDTIFNSAFILSSEDFEVTLISPVRIPAVCNQPIWSSVFDTPSQDLDCMSSEFISAYMLINSGFVGQKVSINSKGRFNWSVFEDFGLYLMYKDKVPSYQFLQKESKR